MQTLPPLTLDTVLRDVQVDDHRLILWETGRRDSMGKTLLAYRLIDPSGETVFEGADYSTPGIIDDDAAVRGILFFLTLRPGDTDDEFFAPYTLRQVSWRDEHAERLSQWAESGEDSEQEPLPLPDHPGAFKLDSYPD